MKTLKPTVASSAPAPKQEAHTVQMAETVVIDMNAYLTEENEGNQHHAPVTNNLYTHENQYLLGDEEQYLLKCVPLHEAAIKGDWIRARLLLGDHPRSMLRMPITNGRQTVLHIAAGARQIAFVKEIIKLMEPEDLTQQDKKGNNAFCVAAAAGSVEIAKVMLSKNPHLVTIRGCKNKTPLYMAVMFGRKEMATLLYYGTIRFLTEEDQTALFFKSIDTNLYGIALKLLRGRKELALTRDDYNDETALHLLAQKPSSKFTPETKFTGKAELVSTHALELLKCLWEEVIRQGHDIVAELITSPTNLLFDAARSGNFRFLAELIHSYPDSVHFLDENNLSIFHIAILHRQTSVFNLIYELGFEKELLATYVDNEDNNMLHLAAKYPDPPPVNGLSTAALELLQELNLFEEVEKLVQPPLREAKNADGLTPRQLFTMHHRSLIHKGEKCMKCTASSCMVVATLIAIIVFSAASTVPGGKDDETGTSLLLKKTFIHVFAISNATALFSSSFSILMFLSILTSGFTQTDDFHRFLPFKLMIGLLALFMSIISMMVTFNSTFFLAYGDGSNSIPVLSLLLASMPITLFALQQYPLLRDVILLTYRSGVLSKSAK